MPDGDIFALKSGILDGDSKSDKVHCNLWSVSSDSYTLPGCMIKRHNIHVNVFTSGKMVCVGLKTSDDVMTIIYPLMI